MKDSNRTISSSAKKVFSGTMLSRITGLGREVSMAFLFGTLPSVAAFWMAFRFAHLFRRIFGEGALHSAFIPHYEHLKSQNPATGARFFYDLSLSLSLLLLLIVLVTEGILGGFLLFKSLSAETEEIVSLTMILLPAIPFISLFAINTSLLNCERSYFLPSISPAILNSIWIAAVVLCAKLEPALAMQRLAMIVVAAFALQWIFTLPKVYRIVNQAHQTAPFSLRSIGKILTPFLLGMIGVTAMQINSALDSIFARIASPEGPAYLWYALRLQQLPLALFGVAIASALFPPISRAIENRDYRRYYEFLNFAVKRAITWMLPITIAIVALGLPAVNLVYGHGNFSPKDTVITTWVLIAYGASLVPMTMVMLFASAFFAIKNYKTPAIFSCLTVLFNIGLNAFFVFTLHLGAISVAIATTLSSSANALLLLWILSKTQGIKWQGISDTTAKLTICSLSAAFVSLLVGKKLPLCPREFMTQLEVFGIQAALFLAVFLLGSRLLKVPMYGELRIRRRREY